MADLYPQPGPQERFLSSSADIAIYGGAAGGGKTFGLTMESVRHVDVPDFGAIVFRRTSPQLVGAGSIWKESKGVFVHKGGVPKENPRLETPWFLDRFKVAPGYVGAVAVPVESGNLSGFLLH